MSARDLHADTGHMVTLECGGCGTKMTKQTRSSGGNRLPGEAVARHFTNRGWLIGSKPHKDRCPDCQKRKPKEESAMAKPGSEIRLVAPVPGASELPPREITREHRRLVFLKLEEVYVDERTGYSAGWNDNRVAEDMGVPRAWVELVREENFGPIKAEESEEVKALRAAIETAESTLEKCRTEAARINGEHNKLAERLDLVMEGIAGATGALTKSRAELAKLTGKAA